jgi:uncharacterized protein (TIGR03503 family)
MWLGATIPLSFCGTRAAAKESDLVLAFDESGSMAKTDPRGARKDAAKLFLRLCGPQHRAALMGFATNVRILGEPQAMGPGDARDRLLADVDRIESSGAYTDIERALRDALIELRRAGAPGRPKAVLLFTDGAVDLQEGPVASAESVRRIRGPLVSDYLQEGVQIHCVAFTSGADLELLRYLAESTGGLCVRGEMGEELQRLFVRLFEEVAQPQTVPVTDSSAVIDLSVREATFLITHKEGEADAVKLTLPDGSALSRTTVERVGTVRWFSSPRVDLVTVTGPQPGKWRIEPAGREGENRVMVLADIELVLDEFHPVSRGSERQWLLASLESQGKRVDTPELVSRITMQATLGGPSPAVFPLNDDGAHGDARPQDGLFATQILAPDKFGSYDVEVVARTPTLERRIVRALNVVSRWFTVEIEKEVVSPGEGIALKVLVDPSALAAAPSPPEFQATVRQPDGAQKILAIIPALDNLCAASFPETSAVGDYSVTVIGTLRDAKGVPAEDTVGPLAFLVRETSGTLVALPFAKETTATAEIRPAPVKPSPTPEVAPKPTPAPPQPAAGSPGSHVLLAVALMVLAAAAGLGGWAVLRRRQPKVRIPSMAPLREKAAEILEGKLETPKQEPQPKPSPASEPASVTQIQAPSEEEEKKIPSEKDIIPEAEPEPLERPDFEGILAAKEDLEATRDQAPRALEPPRQAAPTPSAEKGEGSASLSRGEQDLLSEIMQEISSGNVKTPEAEAPQGQPEALTPASRGTEPGVLPEPLDSAPETQPPAAGTPTIPHEKDDKSEEEAVDEILKEIKGLIS